MIHLWTFSNNGFTFRSIHREELRHHFSLIKYNAVGPDRISLKFLRKIYPFIARYLIFIFKNTILTTSAYPMYWKISRIVAINKKKGTNLFEIFRPICILNTFSKVNQ